ncbi:MAG: hypothetical protein RL150_695 [Candidatus Parcubacteria bacterium]|jgi:hypothetical protein
MKQKQTRTVVALVVLVIIVLLVAILMREPEQVGAPDLGTRGDVVAGETVPTFEE